MPSNPSRETFESADATGNALKQGEYVDVFVREATNKYSYVAGLVESLQKGEVGNLYADLTDSGTNTITGKIRFVVYESGRRDDVKISSKGKRARGDRYDLQTLAAATYGDRQTWESLPAQRVGASEDEVVAVQIKVDNATNDGNTLDTGASDYVIPMTEFQG